MAPLPRKNHSGCTPTLPGSGLPRSTPHLNSFMLSERAPSGGASLACMRSRASALPRWVRPVPVTQQRVGTGCSRGGSSRPSVSAASRSTGSFERASAARSSQAASGLDGLQRELVGGLHALQPQALAVVVDGGDGPAPLRISELNQPHVGRWFTTSSRPPADRAQRQPAQPGQQQQDARHHGLGAAHRELEEEGRQVAGSRRQRPQQGGHQGGPGELQPQRQGRDRGQGAEGKDRQRPQGARRDAHHGADRGQQEGVQEPHRQALHPGRVRIEAGEHQAPPPEDVQDEDQRSGHSHHRQIDGPHEHRRAEQDRVDVVGLLQRCDPRSRWWPRPSRRRRTRACSRGAAGRRGGRPTAAGSSPGPGRWRPRSGRRAAQVDLGEEGQGHPQGRGLGDRHAHEDHAAEHHVDAEKAEHRAGDQRRTAPGRGTDPRPRRTRPSWALRRPVHQADLPVLPAEGGVGEDGVRARRTWPARRRGRGRAPDRRSGGPGRAGG